MHLDKNVKTIFIGQRSNHFLPSLSMSSSSSASPGAAGAATTAPSTSFVDVPLIPSSLDNWSLALFLLTLAGRSCSIGTAETLFVPLVPQVALIALLVSETCMAS